MLQSRNNADWQLSGGGSWVLWLIHWLCALLVCFKFTFLELRDLLGFVSVNGTGTLLKAMVLVMALCLHICAGRARYVCFQFRIIHSPTALFRNALRKHYVSNLFSSVIFFVHMSRHARRRRQRCRYRSDSSQQKPPHRSYVFSTTPQTVSPQRPPPHLEEG